MGIATRPARALLPLFLFAMLGAVASPAAADGEESDFVSRINRERSARGIRTLAVRGDLGSVARRHSARMAADGRIYHNPNLGSDVDGWSMIGENVGVGYSVAKLHQAFMDSRAHRENVLDPRYNQIGVGVVRDGEKIYVTEIFARRGTATVRKPAARRPATPPAAPRPRRRAVRAGGADPAPIRPPAAPRPDRSVTVDLLVRLTEREPPPTGVASVALNGPVRPIPSR